MFAVRLPSRSCGFELLGSKMLGKRAQAGGGPRPSVLDPEQPGQAGRHLSTQCLVPRPTTAAATCILQSRAGTRAHAHRALGHPGTRQPARFSAALSPPHARNRLRSGSVTARSPHLLQRLTLGSRVSTSVKGRQERGADGGSNTLIRLPSLNTGDHRRGAGRDQGERDEPRSPRGGVSQGLEEAGAGRVGSLQGGDGRPLGRVLLQGSI